MLSIPQVQLETLFPTSQVQLETLLTIPQVQLETLLTTPQVQLVTIPQVHLVRLLVSIQLGHWYMFRLAPRHQPAFPTPDPDTS